MSYRRRETLDASTADPFSKTKRLAAVSSIPLCPVIGFEVASPYLIEHLRSETFVVELAANKF